MKSNRFMILGDSYSTFEGAIPEGYLAYYTGHRDKEPDLPSRDATWWGLLAEELGWELVRNDSWSGSTVGFTGYNRADTSATSSFVGRLDRLIEGGFFDREEIDTVFVFGGTNDDWSDAPLGEEKLEGHKREDLFSVLPAIGYLFRRLREVLPCARIVGIANSNIKLPIVTAIENATRAVGGTFVRLSGIEKLASHPTAAGMRAIKEQVAAALRK